MRSRPALSRSRQRAALGARLRSYTTSREQATAPRDLTVALAIERARKAAGLTCGELAERIGCSLSTISRWETGRHLPWLGWRDVIAEACGCPADQLGAAHLWRQDADRVRVQGPPLPPDDLAAKLRESRRGDL